jgi:hypothetical protein
MSGSMPGSRARLHIAVLSGYVVVAVLFTWPLTLHLSSTFPGDPAGDTGVYVWNLWVFRHQILAHHTLPFLTGEILSLDQPAVPLTLHNYTTFADVLAFPLLGRLSVAATFNLLTLGSLVASAYSMFMYALKRTGDAGAAFVGGLLFGFNPFMTARVTAHFSLVQAAPLPIFGLLLYEIFQRPTTRLAAIAGLVVAWAFLCDPYYAVYCLLMVMFVVGYSLVAVERRPLSVQRAWWRTAFDLLLLSVAGLIVGIALRGGGRLEIFGLHISMTRLYTPVLLFTTLLGVRIWLILRPRFAWAEMFRMAHLRFVIVAGFVCVIALSPVLYAMRSPGAGRPWRGPQVLWRSSAPGVDAASWLTPNPFHPLWGSTSGGWLSALPNGAEENVASISLVAQAVIAFSMVRRRFRAPGGWWVFTGLFAWLSLGPFIRIAGINTYVPTPWAVLRYLPVVGAARMPTRMTVLVMMGVSMLLVLAIAHLRQQSQRSRLVVAAIAVLLVFELLPSPRPLYSAEIPGVYQVIAADPRPVKVITLPFGLKDGLSERGAFSARYQYFQTMHEKALIGGYLSRLPDGAIVRYRRNIVVRTLLRLSEGRALDPAMEQEAVRLGPAFINKTHVGYVVIDTGLCSAELVSFAKRAFGLTPVTVDGSFELYRTVGH